ncbi:uncharacterized protein HHUB_3253 [Halobacterium hubeiense]|uniref:Uncharacterized protein n=2 Tax=Halobacterium TaxID=2239 RepID=A0A0U5H3Y7_9EURY|nr:DUF5813 family protein [Halobacterium hubeiense]CQH60595.1 uncharacterized protein HHUB_3253 [Halobacterium hubeiense]
MTDIEQELADHGQFARDDGAFVPTTNDWDATVSADDETVEITVVVPTLDAATNDEVAEVVEDGWYDTFERRVVDADSVTLANDVEVQSVSRAGGDITVEITFSPRTGKAADDALALVNYVEGTWFQGVIPGYDYVEKVEQMRQQAAQNAQSTEGTPL